MTVNPFLLQEQCVGRKIDGTSLSFAKPGGGPCETFIHAVGSCLQCKKTAAQQWYSGFRMLSQQACPLCFALKGSEHELAQHEFCQKQGPEMLTLITMLKGRQLPPAAADFTCVLQQFQFLRHICCTGRYIHPPHAGRRALRIRDGSGRRCSQPSSGTCGPQNSLGEKAPVPGSVCHLSWLIRKTIPLKRRCAPFCQSSMPSMSCQSPSNKCSALLLYSRQLSGCFGTLETD